MIKADKEKEVTFLREDFGSAKLAVLSSFNGLTVEELKRLRSKLRSTGAKIKIVKNTLAKIAVKDTDFAGTSDYFKGPVAVTISKGEDMVESARSLVDFASESSGKIEILCGVIEGSFVDKNGVVQLSKAPPKAVLQSMLLGLFQSPARNMLGLMTNVPRSILNLLKNYASK